MTAAAAPETCGNYLLLERIGSGGMAEVFRAKTVGISGFQRIVAIKKILPVLAEDKRFITMFVDEARIAVELTHAHIVQIYELGISEGEYYIAMEYVHGRDLRQVMKDLAKKGRNVPVPVAAYIASCVCSAIDFAHRKATLDGQPLNIVHRDVSPPNVLLGFDGSVKVADFGIALAKDRVSNTMGTKLKGKIAYMSPEQAWGHELDRRSDIYSAATVLFEMLTGQLPYRGGGNNFELLDKVREADVQQPREVNAGIPPELEGIVLKALSREREQRYAWASDMAEELQHLLIHGRRLFGTKELGAFVKSLYGEAAASEEVHLEALLAEAESELIAAGADPVDWSHVNSTQIVELDASNDTVILAMNPPWATDSGWLDGSEGAGTLKSPAIADEGDVATVDELATTAKSPPVDELATTAKSPPVLATTAKSPPVDELATTAKSPPVDELATTTKTPQVPISPPMDPLAAAFEDPLAETDKVAPMDDRITAKVPAIPENEASAIIGPAEGAVDESMVTAEVEPISEEEALAAIGSRDMTLDAPMPMVTAKVPVVNEEVATAAIAATNQAPITAEVPEVAAAMIARGTLKVELGDHLEGELSEQMDLGDHLDPLSPTFESPVLADAPTLVAGKRTTEGDAEVDAPRVRRGRGLVWVTVVLVVLGVAAAGIYLAHVRNLLPARAAAVLDRVLPRAKTPTKATTGKAKAKVKAKVKAKAKAKAKLTEAEPPVAEEPEPPVEPSVEVSRADVLKLRKVFLAALRDKGVIRGDDVTLDEHRTALKTHYMEGAWADALRVGENAQEALAAIEVDERFVQRKLNRLRRRGERTAGETGRQVELLVEEIEGHRAEGELITANNRLNDGFQLLRVKPE